jgi:hypothetical protein
MHGADQREKMGSDSAGGPLTALSHENIRGADYYSGKEAGC